MKKITLCIMLLASALSWAQSTTDRQLSEGIQKLQTAQSISDYDKTFYIFSSLRAEAGTDTHWLSFYYAGFSAYKQAEIILSQNPSTDVSSFLGMATKATLSAWANSDNVETNTLLGLIELLIAKSNGENNNEANIQKAKNYLEKAEKLDAKNPRVLLLKGKILANLPPQNGGNKTEAKAIFESILQKKNTTSHKMPNWEKKEAKEAISKL